MKLKLLLPLIALLALGTACEKPEETNPPNENPLGDKPPCYGSFSCTINGEPFQSYGTGGGCSPRSISYNTNSKYLHISGIDCRIESNGFRGVVVECENIQSPGTYPILNVNCGFRITFGQLYAYNEEIGGEVVISKLTLPPFSEDYKGGYIEGTFSFMSYSIEANDTAKVTNGEFCGTF